LQISARQCAALALGILAAMAQPAFAQRAQENAVTQADDAFGTRVGNEQIGVYSPRFVRGFSPVSAGNVRIEGLYFDQVSDLNDRVQESSRIRVGIAAQSYAFPAPTGVLDYSLRTPGNAPRVSILSEGNSFGSGTFQLDGAFPLVGDKLSLGLGTGAYRNEFPDGGGNYEHNSAALLRWTPSAGIEFLSFWSRHDTYDEKTTDAYVPASDFLPRPLPGRHFLGPDWAKNRDFGVNYGALARVSFPSDWLLRAGIFRSESDRPKRTSLFLTELLADGSGDLNVYSDPSSVAGSTSGEVRVEKNFVQGDLSHGLILSLRDRSWKGIYGDSAFLDLGSASLGQRIADPRPQFQYGALTHDHVDEKTAGLSYRLAWRGQAQLNLGVQKVNYVKHTRVPGQGLLLSQDRPWLFYGALTGNLNTRLAIFGSFTQGLEESGNAPTNAVNSNQALPASATRQKDAGMRLSLTPTANLVATWFDIRKPYFNLDPGNLFRQLGETQNTGFEFSFSGNIMPTLDLVAGAVLSTPRVGGEGVRLGLVGTRPISIPGRRLDVRLNWRPPNSRHLSFDLGASHSGSQPSTLDNVVSIPGRTFVDADARYEFQLAKQPASLKFAVLNMFNSRAYRVMDSNTYGIFFDSGRRIDLRLIVDVAGFS
jgi:iron complex outermembrane recepter protein